MLILSVSALTIGILLVVFMIYNAFSNNLSTIEVELNRFPHNSSELKVFYISDVHNRVISEKLLNQVHDVELVIIGGDFRDNRTPNWKIEENLKRLSRFGPIYFIWGNNDYEGDVETFKKLLEKWKVIVVGNEVVLISYNGSFIQLAAIEDMSMKKDNVHKTISSINKNECCIFVSHDPRIRRKAGVSLQGYVDLLLSGHTHGGQIRIFGFGPYTLGGVHQTFPYVHFVSNGYGTSIIPLRLGTKAEAHVLTIRKKPAQTI
ncbi:metallophosphoesterase [Mangrovibacillus cuniculi]|uniref:Metallophosphoesterase n=1 Tax=Mangrovibacillus cuniculi TaxID=2593652 RepID=A0A7S8CB41_9BACI|nr:metallophosphoesterase [Mangrovibacillus cuniculi]QPC46726.1 metallophosphoesterase [Mangrovibacillus cuniculi]